MVGRNGRNEEADQTVFRPMRADRRAEARTADPSPTAGLPHEMPAIMADPMLAAATPLLHLLGRLSNTARPRDVVALREKAGREIGTFERTCRQQGVPMELLRPAHYALCVALDDVVLHTTWGAGSSWSERPLAVTRYRDLHTETQFFDMLNQMQQDPTRFLTVLELFYLCLSFGFVGRYRGDQDSFARLRSELSDVIVRQRESARPPSATRSGSLLLHFAAVPAWMPSLAAILVIGSLFGWVSHTLNGASDAIYAGAANAPPTRMPVLIRSMSARPPRTPPPAISSAVIGRVTEALKNEIDGRSVTVIDLPSSLIIRIAAKPAFNSSTTRLRSDFETLLVRVGTILKNQPVSIQVSSYTDATPGRTAHPSSDQQLIETQAQTVRSAILQGFDDAAHITAEGRGEADPIASNGTPEGREQNRRVEVALRPRD
jgi:type VI secretion system protein ImpK